MYYFHFYSRSLCDTQTKRRSLQLNKISRLPRQVPSAPVQRRAGRPDQTGDANGTVTPVQIPRFYQLFSSSIIYRFFSPPQVIRIKVYPSYNSSSYFGDIAMLTLSSDAEFTNYVTPVCLWEERSDDLDDIVEKEGTVRTIFFRYIL